MPRVYPRTHPRCLHCRRRSGCAPRGLCDRCYKDEPLRRCYPTLFDRRPWTRRDGDRVWHMRRHGMTAAEIGRELGRSRGDVEQFVRRERVAGRCPPDQYGRFRGGRGTDAPPAVY